MRIVQLNLNHTRAAQDLLIQLVKEKSIDIAILSEPHILLESTTFHCDKTNTAAIWTAGKHVLFEVNSEYEGFVRAKIEGIYFYSCYARPSWTINEYQIMLDNLVQDAQARSPRVIAGDFNAWATTWGSRMTNQRGKRLLDSFAALDVTLLNEGNKETFNRAGRSSIIDITFISNSLLRNTKWCVSDTYTHSDHQAIMIEVNQKRKAKPPKMTGPKWKDDSFDKESFNLILDDCEEVEGHAENMVQQLTDLIYKACDAAMPKRKQSKRGSPCYWWNEEIKSNRARCFKARRKSQRARFRDNFEMLQQRFKEARRELEISIRNSKRRCFKQLCDETNINPWGTAYRLVMSKIKGQKSATITCPRMLKVIVEHLFPQRPRLMTTIPRSLDPTTIPPVTLEEVIEAEKKIRTKKTPGPDGIPNKAIKTAMKHKPAMFIAVMQKCLEEGVFPKQWKLQNLVLLPKGNKPPEEPSSHRPICLLDSMGKVLERVVYNRLLKTAEENEALSENQFGFRKGRSAIDAIKVVVDTAASAIEGERWRFGSIEYCAVATLDIRNAFNSADWVQIRRSLIKMKSPYYLTRIVENYFENRQLTYHTDDGPKYYNISAGVPQGSVLGPLLWNLMYDGVLRLALPKGVKIVGFADDIAVITVAKNIPEVEQATNEAIRVIKKWLVSANLELADHKTEVVLITGRKVPETMTIQVGGEQIHSKESLKYLGVIIDNRLNFESHVDFSSKKASKMQGALARIMPNIGGPNYEKRVLLANVVSSVLLYAAPIWACSLATKVTRRKLTATYRLTALRTISGFRTISDEAAFVLAGMIPIDLLADEMSRIYNRRRSNADNSLVNIKWIKSEEREITMVRWQNRWDISSKGRWTNILIPLIDAWINRSHGTCNYNLTQFLSGHGGYRKFLHKFGHASSALCPNCAQTEEDAGHVIFNCQRFEEGRTGPQDPSSIVDYMLCSEKNWENICKYVTAVNTELRRLESIRRSEDVTHEAV